MNRNPTAEIARLFNEKALEEGSDRFMSVVFDEPDGFYYDPVGDAIFEVKRVGICPAGPVYKINFGDGEELGTLIDHGLHLRLD